MLIELNKIVIQYQLDIRGVIHIGAHYGQEYKVYAQQGIPNMMFFEPVKDNYKRLIKKLPKHDNIKTYNLALGNDVGEKEMIIEKVKGQSCSFLEPGTHLTLHPNIVFTDREMVKITRLDVLPFDRSLYNMINIDVQGFELEVFKGAVETLHTIDIIYTEVNFEQVYKGCCQVEELDAFLNVFGFERVVTKDSRSRRGSLTWGDALYLKRNG